MGGTQHGPVFLALVFVATFLAIFFTRGAIVRIAPKIVGPAMLGLLMDQRIAWQRMQAEPPITPLNHNTEELFREFQRQMDDLWRPRRDLSLPAHPNEGY